MAKNCSKRNILLTENDVSGNPRILEILQNPGKGQKEAKRGQDEDRRGGKSQKRPGRGQKRPGRGPEEARRRLEEARKRQEEAGRVRNIRKKAPKGQESRIWRKIARNTIFYEQKMTSLGTPNFGDFGESRKSPKEARKRPGRGQKRPGRGQDRPEEARRGLERPGIQNLAKNCSKRNNL